MNQRNEQFYMVNKFLKYRNEQIKYIWSAIGLVILLSLLSNSILTIFAQQAWFIMWGSLIAMFLVLAGGFSKLLPLLDQEKEYTGQIFYNPESQKILTLRDYWFNDRIKEYTESLLAEDKTLARTWKKSSLNATYITNCFKILEQAADFYLLTSLANVLQDFFNDESNNHTRKIKQYKRQDFLPALGNNVFFNLFTKSMGRRKAFKTGVESDMSKGRKIYSAWASNGAYYKYFYLPVPENTIVNLKNNDSNILITIKTPQLELKIWRQFYISKGYAPLDMFWYSNSLENDQYPDIESADFHIKIQVKFNKWRSLFSRKIDDYKWVDQLNINLEKYLDFDEFQAKIKHKRHEYLFKRISTLEKNLKKELHEIKISNKKDRHVHY